MLQWSEVLKNFKTPPAGDVEPDSYRDFLGGRTRLRYMPPAYMALAGTCEGTPGTDRAGLHDIPEWAGVLQSVTDARGKFVAVELGAGYGPFVVGSARAARDRGIKDIRLIAVEGAAAHVEFMHEHFRDNGLDPAEHRILQAVVGTYDGKASFPRLKDPATEWSAEAVFSGKSTTEDRTPQQNRDYETIDCVTIETVIAPVDHVDVMHFDIQGTEADVIEQSIAILTGKVRRIVIGTHGRNIEQRLLEFLDKEGWTYEMDKPCTYQQAPGGITLLQDGVQVWRNPRA
jgi:FkbM family methyltransferase